MTYLIQNEIMDMHPQTHIKVIIGWTIYGFTLLKLFKSSLLKLLLLKLLICDIREI